MNDFCLVKVVTHVWAGDQLDKFSHEDSIANSEDGIEEHASNDGIPMQLEGVVDCFENLRIFRSFLLFLPISVQSYQMFFNVIWFLKFWKVLEAKIWFFV